MASPEAVDDWLAGLLVPPGSGPDRALDANAAAGLPGIDVSALQGRMLGLVMRVTGARQVLEIGTLGGYSKIRMAEALPDGGRLTTIEFDPRHAEVARCNLAAAGVARPGGPAAGCGAGSAARPVRDARSGLHRRRQAEQPGLSVPCPAPVAAREGDRGRQRGAGRRGGGRQRPRRPRCARSGAASCRRTARSRRR